MNHLPFGLTMTTVFVFFCFFHFQGKTKNVTVIATALHPRLHLFSVSGFPDFTTFTIHGERDNFGSFSVFKVTSCRMQRFNGVVKRFRFIVRSDGHLSCQMTQDERVQFVRLLTESLLPNSVTRCKTTTICIPVGRKR